MTAIDESLTAKGFTPAARVPAVYGRKRTIESITIHHWGLRGQTHDGVNNFFVHGPGTTSAHFVVSAGRINCLVSPEDAAWHAGNAVGNATSIGIECRPEASDGDYETVAELVRYLRDTYGANLPLIPHRNWQATACPGIWDLDRINLMASGSPAIASEGTTTTPEQEDEMSAEDIQWIKEKLARNEQLLTSFEKVLTDPVTGVIKQAAELTLKGGVGSRYVRSEVKGEDTVYERVEGPDGGKLRPINLTEFQLAIQAGETYRLVPKWMIDALPKVA